PPPQSSPWQADCVIMRYTGYKNETKKGDWTMEVTERTRAKALRPYGCGLIDKKECISVRANGGPGVNITLKY
ncbi:MAG: hypothetical protein ACQERZ_09440, partial [Fusobacteriota bacterium]